MTRLFLLVSSYTAPLEDVDRVRQRHLAWVAEQYRIGRFLVSGRLVPANGGVIVTAANSREAVNAMIITDPYVVEGLAVYALSEFEVPSTIELSPEFNAFSARLVGLA